MAGTWCTWGELSWFRMRLELEWGKKGVYVERLSGMNQNPKEREGIQKGGRPEHLKRGEGIQVV